MSIVARQGALKKFTFREVSDLVAWRARNESTSGVLPADETRADEWTFSAEETGSALLAKLRGVSQKLEDVTTRIFQGLKTSADDIFIVEKLERRAKRVRVYSHETETEYWLESELLHPLIKGGDSRRYAIAEPRRLIVFPYALGNAGAMELIPQAKLKKDFPQTWHYLLKNRKRLEQREDGKMAGENWYAFGRDQALDVISQPKIFTPDLAMRAAYSLDDTGERFFTGGVAGGYGIVVRDGINRDFVLALLNSRLLDWYVAKTGTTMRGGWHSYEARFIRGAPIFLPPPRDVEGKKRCDEIAMLGGAMLELSEQRQQFVLFLQNKLRHEHRTPCSLAHYSQSDYADAVKGDVLIDDVMRKGFLHGIAIEAENESLLLSAYVSDAKQTEPGIIPVLRLVFRHSALRQFVYACWQQFLSDNARRKMWTTGKQPEEIYRRIVDIEEPLVFFHAAAADNLRAIGSLLEAVAAEAGVSDLAALEAEITAKDRGIDELVYELYDLTAEEIEHVKSNARQPGPT